MPELICKILHIGKTTYYSYLNKEYPIIKFLLSFDKEELEELLSTGKIYRLELAPNIREIELKIHKKIGSQLKKYLDFDYDKNIFDYVFGQIVIKFRNSNIELTQANVLNALIDRSFELSDIKDEISRCAVIAALSVLTNYEFEFYKNYC